MREFGKREFSVFLVKMVKNIAASFDVYGSGSWEEQEICTKGTRDGQKEGERGDGNRIFTSFSTPFTHRPLFL